MKKHEKLEYLHDHHYSEFARVHLDEENKLSAAQSVFCVCGRLATGLHEKSCRRFRGLVMTNTLKRLSHLISNGEPK